MGIVATANLRAEQSSSSVASFTTTAMTVTAGNAIVVSSCVNANTTIAITSTPADTYSQAVIKSSGITGQSVAIDANASITGGSTTWKITPGAAGFCSVGAQEYTGMKTSAAIDTATNTGEGTSQAVDPGAVNPPNSNDLYVSAWTQNGSGNQTFTAGGGFTLRANLTNTSFQPLGSEDLVASGSQDGSATLSGAANPGWDAVAATFIAATGGATSPFPPWSPSIEQNANYRM